MYLSFRAPAYQPKTLGFIPSTQRKEKKDKDTEAQGLYNLLKSWLVGGLLGQCIAGALVNIWPGSASANPTCSPAPGSFMVYSYPLGPRTGQMVSPSTDISSFRCLRCLMCTVFALMVPSPCFLHDSQI
jgi:hypothetical protein